MRPPFTKLGPEVSRALMAAILTLQERSHIKSVIWSHICLFRRVVCVHWLRMLERVQFKITVLTYTKSCTDSRRNTSLGPLNRVTDQPGSRSLRSADTNRLMVPHVMLSSVVNRAFQVVGPRIWNDLPSAVTSAKSLSTFYQWLKTQLFSKSFRGYFLDIN